jgi:hypothetical protein
MIAIMITLILGFGYCEYIWWSLITHERPTDYLQKMMRFFIGLNLIMGMVMESWGNLIIAIILTLYYFVLIPYRISKLNSQ